jgi:hypothetical protein
MDYSLLLAIEQISSLNSSGSRNIFMSRNGKQAYHIAIIDFLQDWSLTKRLESAWKISKGNISAVEPNWYQKRFEKFMINDIF